MNRSIRPYIYATLSVVFWSHAFVSIKYLLHSVTPLELVIMRHIPAALAFTIYLGIKGDLKIVPKLLRAHPVQVHARRPFGRGGLPFPAQLGRAVYLRGRHEPDRGNGADFHVPPGIRVPSRATDVVQAGRDRAGVRRALRLRSLCRRESDRRGLLGRRRRDAHRTRDRRCKHDHRTLHIEPPRCDTHNGKYGDPRHAARALLHLAGADSQAPDAELGLLGGGTCSSVSAARRRHTSRGPRGCGRWKRAG